MHGPRSLTSTLLSRCSLILPTVPAASIASILALATRTSPLSASASRSFSDSASRRAAFSVLRPASAGAKSRRGSAGVESGRDTQHHLREPLVAAPSPGGLWRTGALRRADGVEVMVGYV